MSVFLLGLAVFGLTVYGSSSFAQAPTKSALASTWKAKSITYIKASNSKKDAQFGYSIALSGDGNTLAVGAPFEGSSATGINGNQADNSALGAGAVYIFTRRGDTWSQQAYVKASNTEAGDQFGYSLAISGDGNTLTAGAIGESSVATGINGSQADNSVEGAGAAYVFTRSESTWSQQAYVKGAQTGLDFMFGYSVGLSGDGNTLAVDAYNEAAPRDEGYGAVYVFSRAGSNWSQQAHIKGSNAAKINSIAIGTDGKTIVAGVSRDERFTRGLPSASTGAAYVFVCDGATWTQQAFINASNARTNAQFGWAIALSRDGNTLGVGSPFEGSAATGINGKQADDSASEAGSVYLFTRSGNTWSQQAYVKASNTKASSEFGISVALNTDGKTLAVGAHFESSAAKGISGNQADNSAKNAGAAYVYY